MGLLDKLMGPPSHDKFASLLMAALRDAGDQRSTDYDRNEFRLVFDRDGRNRGVLNLGNLYAEFCQVNKADRKKCLSEMVRAALSHMKEMPDEFADASHDLRPRLWTRSTFEQLRLRQKIEGAKELDWPLEPIGDHLYLSLVYDLPESVRSISQEDLERWEITFWEAKEIAISNLEQTEFVYASVGNQLYASNTRDSYDATRLVLTELIRSLDVEGDPIAMVPNRDTLLVTGTESEVGQKMMLEFALQQLQQQPRPMIATPLILEVDDRWSDWAPPAEHTLFREFNKTKLEWLSVEYEEQKLVLERINEINKSDEVITSFSVVEKNERLVSLCVWNRGTCCLLPKTDLIALSDQTANINSVVQWAEAQREVGHMLEPLDTYPPRFRVNDFPSANELQTMSQKAVGE